MLDDGAVDNVLEVRLGGFRGGLGVAGRGGFGDEVFEDGLLGVALVGE